MLLLKYLTTVFCALFIIIGAASGQEVEVYGEVGRSVSFGATSLASSLSSIIWKQRNGGSVIKAIEWDEVDGVSAPNPRFRDITTLDNTTGQITITNLKFEHSGIYTIDINSKEQEKKFNLKVLPLLPKPEIKVEKIKSDPDAVYLKCEYSETIIWKNSAGETLKGSPQNPQKGELITVKKQGNPDFFYTCTLKNALRNITSDPVYERVLFEGSNTGLILGISIPVLLAVIFIIFIMVYLFMHTVHTFVHNICSCIPNLFGPLDCFLKNKGNPNQEPKPTSPEAVSLKTEGDNDSPSDKNAQ